MPGRGAGHARPRLRRPEGDCVPVSVRCQRRAGARLGRGKAAACATGTAGGGRSALPPVFPQRERPRAAPRAVD